MKKTTRFLALLLLGALALGAFTGCGSANADDGKQPDETPNQGAEATVKDTLVVAMESEPPTLHPYDHAAVTAGYMNGLTFNTLFRMNPETLTPETELVESYERLDESTWSFTIFDYVKFHDGSLMTAEDVVASMEYAREYTTTKTYTSFWADVKATDTYTFEVTTNGAYALTLVDLSSIKVLPKALIDAENDFNLNPVGSGPYKFVSQTLGDKIEFVAFDDYFVSENTRQIKTMTWRVIPEGSSRTIALEAGEVDFVVEVEANDMARLLGSENIEVQTVGGTRVNFLTMNTEVYPFDNKDFRKAVNAAIDKDAVLTVALNGEGKATNATCPTAFDGTSTENAQEYDLEAAKAHLAASGVDPTTVSFACVVSTDSARRAAEAIQAYLMELGLEMTIENMDYAAYLNAVMGGGYTVAVSGYTANSLPRYLSGVFHSSALNAANMPRVQDARVDELVDLAMTQTSVDEANATYKEVTAYLNELSPVVPLYESVVTRAYNANLKGVQVGATGDVRFENLYWAE